MATASSTSSSGKAVTRAKGKVVRSSVTGRFVLAPASKAGRITIAQARTAAKTVDSKKK